MLSNAYGLVLTVKKSVNEDGDWGPQTSSPTGRVKGVYKPLTSIWKYRFLFTPKANQ